MDDFTSFDLPEISQVPRGARRPEGIVSSLVWNAPQVCLRGAAEVQYSRRSRITYSLTPQRPTSLSDGDGICQLEGMTSAAGSDGSCDEHAQSAKDLKAGLGA